MATDLYITPVMLRARHHWVILLFIASIALTGSGCVYYNTFFHAKKKFNDAEKSQKDNAEKQLQAQVPSPTPPGGQTVGGGRTAVRPQPGGQQISKANAQERALYESAIEKAKKVLANHPKSKWADDALWLIGKSYFNMGDYLLSSRALKELITNHPKSKFVDESYYYLALCQVNLGHNDQARSSLVSLAETGARGPYIDDALYAQGAMEMAAENYSEAAEFFHQYATRYPDGDSAAVAMHNLGRCHEKLENFPGAFEAFAAVKGYNPSRTLYFEAELASATAALKSDSIETGMKILENLARDERYFSRAGQIHLRVAEGYRLQGKIDEAIKTYQEITSSNQGTNESAEAYYRLGLICQNERFNLVAAKEAFGKCQQEAPDSDFKNLALARSAQIAKLETYRAQLQQADSLKMWDELSSLEAPPIPEHMPAVIDTPAIPIPDTTAAGPAPETTYAVSQVPAPDDSAALASLSNTELLNMPVADTSGIGTIGIDTVRADSGAIDTTALVRSLPVSPDRAGLREDSLRLERITRMLGAVPGAPPLDSAALQDTVLFGQQGDEQPAAAQAQVTSEDSLRQAIVRSGIETRYLLSELYAYELNQPDSAVREFLLIADEHPGSPFAPRSLLAAAQIRMNIGDTSAAVDLLQRLIEKYPQSPQAAQAAQMLGRPFDLSGNAVGLYAAAESLIFFWNNPDSALALFAYIAGRFPDFAPKAAFAAAWVLDRVKGVEDSSAYYAYSNVTERYPDTQYAQAAKERLGLASSQSQKRTGAPQPSQPEQPSQNPKESAPDTTVQLAGGYPPAPSVRVPGQFLYPEALLARELRGKVIFKIKLDISGRVEEFEIIGPSGEFAIDSSATAALLATEFDVSGLDLAQLSGYFQYSITFERPNINIWNDQYLQQREGGGG